MKQVMLNVLPAYIFFILSTSPRKVVPKLVFFFSFFFFKFNHKYQPTRDPKRLTCFYSRPAVRFACKPCLQPTLHNAGRVSLGPANLGLSDKWVQVHEFFEHPQLQTFIQRKVTISHRTSQAFSNSKNMLTPLTYALYLAQPQPNPQRQLNVSSSNSVEIQTLNIPSLLSVFEVEMSSMKPSRPKPKKLKKSQNQRGVVLKKNMSQVRLLDVLFVHLFHKRLQSHLKLIQNLEIFDILNK